MKTTQNGFRMRQAALVVALMLACGAAPAATVLEYRHEGDCATDFERMAIDGLRMRIDMRVEGMAMTSLVDDDEQLMHQVMHDSRTYMTMESDDDAVDFNSDVARSTVFHAQRQVQAVTGMDNDAIIAQARATQIAACPEMAGLGFGDPDYAEAASRCAEKMSTKAQSAGPSRRDAVALAGGRAYAGAGVGAAPAHTSEAPTRWSTTTLDRDAAATRVEGHSCTLERIRRGPTVLREDCLAPVDSLALEPRAVRRLARLARVGEGLGAGVADLHPEMQDASRNGTPTLSLRRTCYRDGRAIGNAVLQIRTDVAVDAAQFELPAGYAPLHVEKPSKQTPGEALEMLGGLR